MNRELIKKKKEKTKDLGSDPSCTSDGHPCGMGIIEGMLTIIVPLGSMRNAISKE